ncbi:MAG: GWxTD domain-containing protein [Gemmatimonadetes bacterium]|nr:GWxTD domain-containing protein [Gemmatimonadota bacterium]
MRHIILAVFLLLSASEALASTNSARMESLFREASAQVGKVPPEVSIKAFEEVLKLDWRFAPAHYEIAKQYLEMNTPLTRQSARKALDEALRLDPENTDYVMTLGELLSKQGFTFNAERLYRELSTEDVGNAEAAYWEGFYAVQEYLALIDKKQFVRLDKDDRGAIYYWETFAGKARERAERLLQKSIKADPDLKGAYNLLGLLHIETGRPEALIILSRRLLDQSPGDKDGLLFCGLGYHIKGKLNTAYNYYRRAIGQMTGEERSMMESVDIVSSEEDRRRLAAAITYGDSIGENWTRNLLERYWRSQDPLFLTRFNERKMEHYGRVAYANLRFARPFKDIEGWQTDPGMAFIKFGRYVGRDVWFLRKVWNYENFRIWFENGDGLDGWRFSRGSDTGKSARESTETIWVPVCRGMVRITRMRVNLSDHYSGRDRKEALWRTPRRSARKVFQDNPQRYIDPYRERKYRMPRQVAAFREADSIRVEFAYAIPKARVKVSDPDGYVDLEDGVFLFDEQWDEVYKRKTFANMPWPEFEGETETKSDSLRRNHIVSFRKLRVPYGPHRIVVEVRDRGTGSIGTFRELRAFDSGDSLLAVSDLLLASEIQTKTSFPEGRNDLRVTPNPLHTYGRNEPVFIYLEIYNLDKDRFGRTKYRISYRLTQPDREEILPERFAALDQPGVGTNVQIQTILEVGKDDKEHRIWEDEGYVTYRVKYSLPERNRISEEIKSTSRVRKGAETTVTSRYEGNQKDDFTFLQVDASSAPAGFHKLIVTLKDLYTGETAERHVVFRLVE